MILSICGGKYKRSQIKIPDNLSDFRPTKAVTREAVCNVLQRKTPKSEVLELCAGSAVFSMEAVSRGAKSAVAVEKNAELCDFMRKQLKKFPWSEQLEILNGDVSDFVQTCQKKFDIIYFDPPYFEDGLSALVKDLPRLLKEGGTLAFEFAAGDNFASQTLLEMGANGNVRKYGKSSIAFIGNQA